MIQSTYDFHMQQAGNTMNKLTSRSLAALAGFAILTGCATDNRGPAVEFLDPGTILPSGLPFSEAVRVNDTLYLSGMVGVLPGTLELAPGGIEEESRQTMDNIRMTLEAHGASMDDVVKCTVMLADISEWGTFNEIYKTYFNGRFPARSALGANGLALGARVEVDCIAVIEKR
ncbi:MAG: Rid family detoxifying hydrolase [Phycisphaerales bacterium]|nr:Rid family detoxifying hydrolase [Phycisphaerales bacterium]